MSRRKKDDDRKKKPQSPDSGTLVPNRGADFHGATPGDEMPQTSLPLQPAGGEQFGTLQAGSDPSAGKPPLTSTKTVSSDSSIIQPSILQTIGAPGTRDARIQTARERVSPGSTEVAGGTMPPGSASTVDLSRVLNIRRHNVEGELSGIVPVATPDDQAPESLIDAQDRAEYEVLSELARGGMGVVYTAVQTSLNRQLVVKTLKPGSGTTEEGGSEKASTWQEDRKLRDMFVSEAVITANLVHPNIVPVHDLGQTEDGKLFYAMKKVDGVPWHHRIADMTLEENLDILMKVADGVAFAHYNGVINRDLKPENVAIGAFGEVAVLDWGLAVTTSTFKQRDSVVAQSEGFGGSPGYMAPEQVRGAISEIGYHTDIYLLGAILYQILTGRAPHHFAAFDSLEYSEAIRETLQAALNNDIEQTTFKGELLDIALKAMATEPKDRYQKVEGFQEALREYRITGRAEELLRGAPEREKEHGYSDYQSAVALYDEAARKWPGNRRATEGLREARLKYAALAHKRGDYDLGLQVVGDSPDPEFDAIRRKLKNARRNRGIVRWTWGIATIAAVLGFAFAGYQWIQATNAQKETADALNKLEDATGDLETVQKNLSVKQEELTAAQASVEQAQRDVDQAKADLTMAQEELTTAQAEVSTTKEELAGAKQQVADAMVEVNAAKEQLTTAQRDLMTAKGDLEAAKQEVANAEMAKSVAEAQTTSAEFLTWQTRLSSASRSGDYEAAIGVLNEMLEDADGDGKADNELVEQSRSVFTRLRESLKRNRAAVQGAVNSAAIDGSGKNLVVAGTNLDGQPEVTLWPVGEELAEMPAVKVAVAAQPEMVTVSEKAGLFATVADDGVTLFRLDGEAAGGPLAATNHTTAVRFSGDGTRLLTGSREGLVQIFDVTQSPARLLGSRDLDYRVDDLLWLSEGQEAGHLLAVLSGTRQALCGSIPWRQSGQGFEFPARDSEGAEGKWTQLKLPGAYRPRLTSLFLSGDAQALAITAKDSGDLLVFPRRESAAFDEFPFLTALELDEQNLSWRFSSLHSGTITQVAFSPSGKRVLTGADDATVRVWNYSGGTLRPDFTHEFSVGERKVSESNQLMGHSDAIAALRFVGSSDDLVLSASLDRSIRLWNLAQYAVDRELILQDRGKVAGLQRKTVRRDVPVRIDADGKAPAFFFTSFRPEPEPQQEEPREPVVEIEGHVGKVSSAAFDRDGQRIVTAGQDQTAQVWRTRDGAPVAEDNVFAEGHEYNVSNVQFLPDGRYLATTSYDGTFLIWDTEDDNDGLGREVARLSNLGMASAVAISADGAFILTSTVRPDAEGRQTYGAQLWKTADLIGGMMKPEAIASFLNAHEARVSALAITPSSDTVVTADRLGRIALWNTDGQQRGETMPAHDDGISAMAFISDDEFVTAGFDGRIRYWNIESDGSLKQDASRPFQLEQDYVWRLRVSPDNTRLLTSAFAQDKGRNELTLTVQAWDLTTGEVLGPPVFEKSADSSAATAYEHDLAWSPDGTRASLAFDGTLIFYETEQWKPVLRLKDKSGRVEPASIVYSPVGGGEFATYDGRTVHLWQLTENDGRTEALHAGTLRANARVAAAGFSADGKYIVTASRSIRVFDASRPDAASILRIEESGDPDDPQPLIHGGVLTWAEFSPTQGSYEFATSGLDKIARLWRWDPSNVNPPTHRNLKHNAAVRQIRWAPDASSVLTVSEAGEAYVWTTGDAPQKVALPLPDGGSYRFHCCAFSMESEAYGETRWVAVGGLDLRQRRSVAFIWELTADGPRFHCTVPAKDHGNRGVSALDFTPDGRLVTGGPRGALLKWEWRRPDEKDGRPEARLLFPIVRMDDNPRSTAHRGEVTSIDIAPDGTMVSSGSDGALIWAP